MAIITQIRDRLRNLEAHMTPLVAYGILFIAGVVMIFTLLKLSDVAAVQANKAKQARAEVEALKEVQSANIWKDRFETSQTVRQQVDEWIWSGITSGVIAAELQQKLRKLAGDNEIENLNIRIDPQAETLEEVDVILFEFRGSYKKPLQPLEMLTDLTSHKKLILIRDANFSVRQSRQSILSFSGMIPVIINAENVQAPISDGS